MNQDVKVKKKKKQVQVPQGLKTNKFRFKPLFTVTQFLTSLIYQMELQQLFKNFIIKQ